MLCVFAVLAAGVCVGQAPHTGVPEIVTCPTQTPTDCEQFFWLADIGTQSMLR
ncbi:MAG: hypothetical protein RL650_1634 [Pseudomonadota bacterium]|jgi:hypothetical protein